MSLTVSLPVLPQATRYCFRFDHISKKEVKEFSPSLADNLARNTATDTVEDIASEISQMILGV